MNVVLCDDQPDVLQTLNPLVKAFFNEKQVDISIETYACLHDVMESSCIFDIAFLDIELPDGSGLQAAAKLRQQNENIIIFIVTSHQHYLDDAMDLNVFRYLSKPIDKERLNRNLLSAWKHYCAQTQTIFIGNHGDATRIFTKDILYVCIKGRGTELVTTRGSYESTQSLSHWVNQLGDAQFAQPHYSYLVNLRRIIDLKKRELTLLQNESDKTITLNVSQRKYPELKRALFALIGGSV